MSRQNSYSWGSYEYERARPRYRSRSPKRNRHGAEIPPELDLDKMSTHKKLDYMRTVAYKRSCIIGALQSRQTALSNSFTQSKNENVELKSRIEPDRGVGKGSKCIEDQIRYGRAV